MCSQPAGDRTGGPGTIPAGPWAPFRSCSRRWGRGGLGTTPAREKTAGCPGSWGAGPRGSHPGTGNRCRMQMPREPIQSLALVLAVSPARVATEAPGQWKFPQTPRHFAGAGAAFRLGLGLSGKSPRSERGKPVLTLDRLAAPSDALSGQSQGGSRSAVRAPRPWEATAQHSCASRMGSDIVRGPRGRWLTSGSDEEAEARGGCTTRLRAGGARGVWRGVCAQASLPPRL